MSQHEEQVLGGAGGLWLPVTETQGWELEDWGGIGSTTGGKRPRVFRLFSQSWLPRGPQSTKPGPGPVGA